MNTASPRRRLEALEKDLSSEPIVLLMPDGRTDKLPCHNVTGRLWRAVRGERTPETELIARSISSTEPDGAHMIDLARALLNSPMEGAL
ncbi:MAG TPA: hypothetical protein VHY84_00555 [Bryobacteraceae bacterium]|jgi:hypothetical protein|nr:hypothetical protein [Bryobacteraceae bacterium]